MGIDTSGAQFLFAAKATGADFTDSLMIGRQFFYPEPKALAQMFRWHRIDRDAVEFIRGTKGWGEEFFRLLGATSIGSLDASPSEGANVIHDLNFPINESLKERFSVVYDGGTLEHVFNFPQALHNCMEMLREGGTFIQYGCPANNFMGHGFYQVSPELVYRVFSKQNGFEIITVLMHESVRGGRWYTVADPAALGKRVQMTNRLPTSVCTIARRVASVSIFQGPPQQSDYAACWQQPATPSGGVYRTWNSRRGRLARLVKRYLPGSLERFLRVVYTPALDAQPDCYRRLDVSQLVRGKFT